MFGLFGKKPELQYDDITVDSWEIVKNKDGEEDVYRLNTKNNEVSMKKKLNSVEKVKRFFRISLGITLLSVSHCIVSRCKSQPIPVKQRVEEIRSARPQ